MGERKKRSESNHLNRDSNHTTIWVFHLMKHKTTTKTHSDGFSFTKCDTTTLISSHLRFLLFFLKSNYIYIYYLWFTWYQFSALVDFYWDFHMKKHVCCDWASWSLITQKLIRFKYKSYDKSRIEKWIILTSLMSGARSKQKKIDRKVFSP